MKARCACFKQILPLVGELLAGERREGAGQAGSGQTQSLTATNDRLLQLIIKVKIRKTSESA